MIIVPSWYNSFDLLTSITWMENIVRCPQACLNKAWDTLMENWPSTTKRLSDRLSPWDILNRNASTKCQQPFAMWIYSSTPPVCVCCYLYSSVLCWGSCVGLTYMLVRVRSPYVVCSRDFPPVNETRSQAKKTHEENDKVRVPHLTAFLRWGD